MFWIEHPFLSDLFLAALPLMIWLSLCALEWLDGRSRIFHKWTTAFADFTGFGEDGLTYFERKWIGDSRERYDWWMYGTPYFEEEPDGRHGEPPAALHQGRRGVHRRDRV